MVKLFKTLGDLNRLRILNLVREWELCVCEIEVLLDLSQSNASRHLGKLREAGIISGDKDGQWIHYRIDPRFSETNPQLLAFLNSRFDQEEVFLKDAGKCLRYKESPYSCQTITEDKDFVMVFLHGKDV